MVLGPAHRDYRSPGLEKLLESIHLFYKVLSGQTNFAHLNLRSIVCVGLIVCLPKKKTYVLLETTAEVDDRSEYPGLKSIGIRVTITQYTKVQIYNKHLSIH